MPWTGKTFAGRHNHSLHGGKADHAARVANAILKRTGDEGLAIATANAREKRADGGGVDDGGAIGGVTPSASMTDPVTQSMIQQFSGMPGEQLRETVLRLGPASPLGRLAAHVLQQKSYMPSAQTMGWAGGGGRGMPRAPAAAAEEDPMQYGMAAMKLGNSGQLRGLGGSDSGEQGYADGGEPSSVPPWWGRGGKTRDDRVPVMLSDGELILTPEEVIQIGGGDEERGHNIIDAFIVHERKKNIKALQKLPGPVKE